jgi:hypothetical protein
VTVRRALAAAAALAALAHPAWAEAAKSPVAVFAGLDKITGKITNFEVPVDEKRQFGSLVIYPRVCYSRPLTEEPKTSTFVEISQVELDTSVKRIFSGWMFAESPGLNALEHPIYDVWLKACRDPAAQAPKAEPVPKPAGSKAAPAAPDLPKDAPKDND